MSKLPPCSGADAAAERGDERADLGRREHLVEARALDVEDLALERQDRLELAGRAPAWREPPALSPSTM